MHLFIFLIFSILIVISNVISNVNAQFDYSVYYGDYEIRPGDASGCDNLGSYCCLQGLLTVSAGNIYPRLSINGTYTALSKTNCLSNVERFIWTLAMTDNVNGAVTSGLDPSVATVRMQFNNNSIPGAYQILIFFSKGYTPFYANGLAGISLNSSPSPSSVPSSSWSYKLILSPFCVYLLIMSTLFYHLL